MKKLRVGVCAMLAGLGTCSSSHAEPIDLQALFQKATHPPTLAYSGRMMLTVKHGEDNQSAEMEVAFRPPQWSRYDVWNADGVLQSSVVDDGKTHWTFEPLTRRAWKGALPIFSQRSMNWRHTLLLLRQNYAVRQAGQEAVAGVIADILEFIPQNAEQPAEQLWIDPGSGAILKTRAWLQNGSWEYSAAFTRINFPDDLPAGEFVLTLPEGVSFVEQPAEATYFSPAEVIARMDGVIGAPALLPEGFHFESASVKAIGGARVAHLRYSDGLNVASVFESTGTLPWQIPPQAESFQILGRTAWLTVLEEQKILGWTDGPLHGVVLGAMSREALVRLAEALMQPHPPSRPPQASAEPTKGEDHAVQQSKLDPGRDRPVGVSLDRMHGG